MRDTEEKMTSSIITSAGSCDYFIIIADSLQSASTVMSAFVFLLKKWLSTAVHSRSAWKTTCSVWHNILVICRNFKLILSWVFSYHPTQDRNIWGSLFHAVFVTYFSNATQVWTQNAEHSTLRGKMKRTVYWQEQSKVNMSQAGQNSRLGLLTTQADRLRAEETYFLEGNRQEHKQIKGSINRWWVQTQTHTHMRKQQEMAGTVCLRSPPDNPAVKWLRRGKLIANRNQVCVAERSAEPINRSGFSWNWVCDWEARERFKKQ